MRNVGGWVDRGVDGSLSLSLSLPSIHPPLPLVVKTHTKVGGWVSE